MASRKRPATGDGGTWNDPRFLGPSLLRRRAEPLRRVGLADAHHLRRALWPQRLRRRPQTARSTSGVVRAACCSMDLPRYRRVRRCGSGTRKLAGRKSTPSCGMRVGFIGRAASGTRASPMWPAIRTLGRCGSFPSSPRCASTMSASLSSDWPPMLQRSPPRIGFGRSGGELGCPFAKANEACGVKNAATRKYLTGDHLWYFPPPDVFQRLVDYANTHGDPLWASVLLG